MKATALNVFFCLIQQLIGRAYLGQAIAGIDIMSLAETQGSPRLESVFIEVFLALLARGYLVAAGGRGVLLTRNNWKSFPDNLGIVM